MLIECFSVNQKNVSYFIWNVGAVKKKRGIWVLLNNLAELWFSGDNSFCIRGLERCDNIGIGGVNNGDVSLAHAVLAERSCQKVVRARR